jgi:hypothetical protein
MKRRIMHGWLYQLTTMVLALTAVLFFWSTQAAWGRIEVGHDRYRVGLLGVNHIFNVGSASESNERCGWYDVEPIAPHCRPAPNEQSAYRLVRLAPIAAAFCEVAFVLAAFAHLRRGSEVTGMGLAPFAITSALALVAGILLLTRNVSSALAIVGESEVSLDGSGLTAAWLTAALLLAAAALSKYSAPAPQASE